MSARTLNYKARGLAKRKYSSWSPQGKIDIISVDLMIIMEYFNEKRGNNR